MMLMQRRVLIAALVAVVAAALTVLVVSGDNKKDRNDSSTTTTAPKVTTTTTTNKSDTLIAVWPVASSTTRYGDAAAAAEGFAVEFVGFVDPIIGELRAGDARSGEVDIQPFPGGPITTVLVRQLGTDSSWWVLGTATANIEVQEPAAMADIASPVTLAGTSTAFEGTVQVQIREDGRARPLGESFVTGGANGMLGPFDGTLEFSTPSAPHGALLFFTTSQEDGSILEASVIRVGFE